MMQAGFSLGMFFDAEDGEHTILRNVELWPNYTVLQSRRPYSELIIHVILKTLETDCVISHACKILIQMNWWKLKMFWF
jgi:hypothetical protein